jgi:transposase
MKDDPVPRPYPSDLTDGQWSLIAPMMPVKTGGRPAIHSRRRIVDAILYLNRTGCAWRMLPHDFPPWDTVYWYFQRWNAGGTTDRIHDALRAAVRDADGRDPMASAGIVDAQSVKGADTVPRESRGYDAGKKTNGRKRHVVVDTTGLLLVVMATAASVQDRDGGRMVLDKARMAMPSPAQVWADGGYAGKLVGFARQRLQVNLEIVKKPKGQHTFEALPRRWVVERTLAGALPPPRTRLRTASRPCGGDGQVGHDRADGQAPSTAAGPSPLATGNGGMSAFPTRS